MWIYKLFFILNYRKFFSNLLLFTNFNNSQTDRKNFKPKWILVLENGNTDFESYRHARRFKCESPRAQLATESSDSISYRNNGRKQLSQIFKSGQWKFYSSRDRQRAASYVMSAYIVRSEIKFLIELLHLAFELACISVALSRLLLYIRFELFSNRNV